MPRYFFHLRHLTDLATDHQGIDMDLEAVSACALFNARSIISHDARCGLIDLRPRIDVEDEHGRPVHSLSFRDAVTITRE
ncbi:DUF6894 family protein [Brevundimonas faecalis]|uniref:DUF6894 family protein n=1 Tax=Brevundimonas faecalis TaxID=947378 RepID=UPI003F492D52